MSRVARILSHMLRHAPKQHGMVMDNNGRVAITPILEYLSIDMDTLTHIVDTNNKKRFTITEDGLYIYATNGHSVNVDLQLKEYEEVPNELFHGTCEKSLDVIMREGIKPMGRLHVHMTESFDTAIRTGARHGSPIVLSVNAGKMKHDGYGIFKLENGVWLTDYILPKYINIKEL